MNSTNRWIVFFAAFGGAACAALLRSKRHNEKQVHKAAHKAELHEWENEGGNLAPPPEVLVTTGSA
jgi:hypothetical protein